MEYLQIVLEPVVQLIQQLFAQVVDLRTPTLKILECTPRFGQSGVRLHLLKSIHRKPQLTPVLGLDPNTDPGLAGETGASGD
jgi:hypothetical protein